MSFFPILAPAAFALDSPTLIVLAGCIAALLGALLLMVWHQDRSHALGWWAAAYLLGGLSVGLWSAEDALPPALPAGLGNALLFVACGTMWSAARLFHGRRVRWLAMMAGAVIWLAARNGGSLIDTAAHRLTLSALIIACYVFLTAHELWRERRKALIRRRLAVVVPALHGMVFLLPALFSALPDEGGVVTLATGWVAVFAIEAIVYAVGAAFIVLVLAQERKMRLHRDAAQTDALTGALNRRGFLDRAGALVSQQGKRREPVTVLLFDLDRFKSVNDRFGHAAGDDVIRLFAATARGAIRADDIFGRIGGEEFSIVIAGSAEDGAVVAERVRFAFEIRAAVVAGCEVEGTVSVGVASAVPDRWPDPKWIETLMIRADGALYRAKERGRNRVEIAEAGPYREAPPPAPRAMSAEGMTIRA